MPCEVPCSLALVMPVFAVIVVSCAPFLNPKQRGKESACALQIFKRFHAAYVDAVCNPFYSVSTVRAGRGIIAWLQPDRVLPAKEEAQFWSPRALHAMCSRYVIVRRHSIQACG